MPPIAPRRRPNPPCFMHLYRRVLTRSRCPSVSQSEPASGPFGPPGRPGGPLPPSNCAKTAGAGAFPPLRPGWATPSPKPPRGGGVAASPHMEGGFNCHAANSRIPSFAFYVRLGSPVLQVVALSARLDEISLPPAAQSEPFFGLFGPSGRPRAEALSHPVTAQNSLGRGRPAQPAKPKKKLRLRRKIEGNRSPRRTALKTRKKCHVLIPCRCDPPEMAVVRCSARHVVGQGLDA
jgi:hypothetical protein